MYVAFLWTKLKYRTLASLRFYAFKKDKNSCLFESSAKKQKWSEFLEKGSQYQIHLSRPESIGLVGYAKLASSRKQRLATVPISQI